MMRMTRIKVSRLIRMIQTINRIILKGKLTCVLRKIELKM